MLGVTLATLAIVAQAPVPPIRGLSRSNLLEVRDASGAIRVATTPAEWESRRREALAGFFEVAGPMPGDDKRCPLNVKLVEETDRGSYVQRLVTYASEPGARVPAFLLVPKAALLGRKAPAVLGLHQTNNALGHREIVGLGGRKNLHYAAELAERGYVVLAPSYPLLHQYQPDVKALGYASGTMKAIWDNVRGLDWLDSLPFVDRDKGYATIGHSLGGHNSIYTAVCEPRLKAVATSCGFDSLLDYYGGNIKGYVQVRYMMRMENYLGRAADVPFDYYELIAMLAPRHVFVSAPKGDGNFRWASVDRIRKAAEPVFALHGAAGRLVVEFPDCGHDFPEAMRLRAYATIEAAIGPGLR